MAITYQRAPTVAPGDRITSTQWNKLAEAFNDRLRQGVGDPTWRLIWWAHSLFRGIRNPDASGFLFPPEDEWWAIWAHIDPSKTAAAWPEAGAGEAEGVNVANPMGAFVHGNEGADLYNEAGRLNYDAGVAPTTGIPLWFTGYGPPVTLADFWVMAQYQRGAILASATYDMSTANAVRAARSHQAIRYPSRAYYHKGYGGFIPTPDYVGDCADGVTPDLSIFFTSLKGASTKTYSTCPEDSGAIFGIWRAWNGYWIAKYDGTIEVLPYSDWTEGPYTTTPILQRSEGEQLNHAINWFAAMFRGSVAQRADASFHIEKVGFDFQAFLGRQYSLAPAYGVDTGSAIEAQYPGFTFTGPLAAGTMATLDGTSDDVWEVPAGFTFAGFYAEGTDAGSVVVQVLDSNEVIYRFALSDAAPAHLHYFDVARPQARIRFRLETPLSSGSITIEAAPLYEMKPGIEDAYLLLRMATTDGADTDLDTIGQDWGQSLEVFKDHWDTGCIVNDGTPETASTTNINRNPVYEAARQIVHDRMRMVERPLLKGYAVEGGKSVLWFDRYARGVSSQDFDVFRGLAPDSAAVASGGIVAGETYVVTGAGSLQYNRATYAVGDTFVGAEGVTDYTGDATPKVYDGIRSSPLPAGTSNEWVMSMSTAVYEDSDSSIWKPESYADIIAFQHDRCGFLSADWQGLFGGVQKQINRHVAHGSKLVMRAENPTGWRYLDGTHNSFSNGLITSINTPGCTTDCEGTEAHFDSCRIYEPDYQVESVVMDGSEVKVTLTGRLRHHASAPASIGRDTSAWGGPSDDFSTEEPRYDENAVREYLYWKAGGGHCDMKIGDVAPDANSGSGFAGGDFNGSCFPRFYFTRLVRRVYEDDNETMEEHDTPLVVDELLYSGMILQAICEGFVDERSTLDVACNDPDNMRLFDYSWESLALQAFQGGYQVTYPSVVWNPGGSRTLTWDDSGGHSYTVQARNTVGGTWTDIATGATSPYTDTTGYLYYRVRWYAGGSNRWLSPMPIAERPDRPRGFGPLPNTICYAEIYNNLANGVNLLVRARVDLPLTLSSQFVVSTRGVQARTPDLVELSLPAEPSPCTDEYLYTGLNAAVFDNVTGVPVSGADDFCSGGACTPVAGTGRARGQTWVAPWVDGEGVYIECGTGKWMLEGWYETGKVVIDPNDQALTALPETIRDMVRDTPGVLGIMEEYVRWHVRDDSGGARPSCRTINLPASWEDGTVSVTPKYLEYDQEPTPNGWCVLYEGEEITPPALPETDMWTHKSTGGVGDPYCIQAVNIARRDFTPASGERLFVRVPLVD